MLKRFFFYWLPVMVYMGIIFYLSCQPDVPIPSFFPGFDKLLHTLEYAGLGFLLIRALLQEYPRHNELALKCTALFIAALYGLSDEFHQGFVSGRTMDFFDWCADSGGAALGAFIHFRHTIESRA